MIRLFYMRENLVIKLDINEISSKGGTNYKILDIRNLQVVDQVEKIVEKTRWIWNQSEIRAIERV